MAKKRKEKKVFVCRRCLDAVVYKKALAKQRGEMRCYRCGGYSDDGVVVEERYARRRAPNDEAHLRRAGDLRKAYARATRRKYRQGIRRVVGASPASPSEIADAFDELEDEQALYLYSEVKRRGT